MIKLNKAVGNDDLRPQMKHAMIKDGYIIVTNAHILTKHRLTYIGFTQEQADAMEGKYIHRDQLTRLASAKEITSVDGLIINCIKGTAKKPVEFSVVMKEECDGTFPNTDPIIADAINNTGKGDGLNTIGINYNLIGLLPHLIHNNDDPSSGAVFKFGTAKNKAILVHGREATLEDELILIMPIMI